ncbi:MAG: Hsp33 family molecular chaperone HslO, partial [Oscillospiraceae bacterium]
MGNLVRMISEDGSVMACAINSTDIVAEIEKIHQTSAVVTAAIGRLSTAASIMGYSLKGDDDTLTLRMNGNGATGSMIAVANSKGNVKAYVQNPVVELPL